MSFYIRACEILEANGYMQLSMRRFSKTPNQKVKLGKNVKEIPEYSCQNDGMIGIGCGARSYTSKVHYSSKYAVGQKEIESILKGYINSKSFSAADYGFILDTEEKKRRYILKSILHYQGLDRVEYELLFKSDSMTDFPEIKVLIDIGFAYNEGKVIKLSREGLGYSDSIGPWLLSEKVRTMMEGYELV